MTPTLEKWKKEAEDQLAFSEKWGTNPAVIERDKRILILIEELERLKRTLESYTGFEIKLHCLNGKIKNISPAADALSAHEKRMGEI